MSDQFLNFIRGKLSEIAVKNYITNNTMQLGFNNFGNAFNAAVSCTLGKCISVSLIAEL